MMLTAEAVPDGGVKLAVVSATAGRMRVRTTGFQFDAARAAAIEETVGSLTGVRAVHAYPRTASVVIWHSRECGETATVLSAIAAAEHMPAVAVPPQAAGVSDGGVAGKV